MHMLCCNIPGRVLGVYHGGWPRYRHVRSRAAAFCKWAEWRWNLQDGEPFHAGMLLKLLYIGRSKVENIHCLVSYQAKREHTPGWLLVTVEYHLLLLV